MVEAPFTSTSTPFGRNTLFIIEGLHGKNIAAYSGHPSEKEILYAAPSRFRVTRRQTVTNPVGTFVEETEMEEID